MTASVRSLVWAREPLAHRVKEKTQEWHERLEEHAELLEHLDLDKHERRAKTEERAELQPAARYPGKGEHCDEAENDLRRAQHPSGHLRVNSRVQDRLREICVNDRAA